MASPRYDFDLLCIGSGPAGQRAAIQAAKLGKRVAVIERRRLLGGVCAETGTIPSKTFREAVLSFMCAAHHVEQHLGNHFDSRPTAAQVLSRVAEVTKREVEVVADQLRRNDVVLIQGEASFTGAHTVTVASEQEPRIVTAANILIAVGTIPAHPEGVPVDGEVILTSDDMLNLKRLPRKMVVIGGGIIGLEYASMLTALNVKVTVIEQRPTILDFVDHEISEALCYHMRRQGVVFRLGEKVTDVQVDDDGVVQAEMESGKRVRAQGLLYAVGRQANTDLLDLEAAGLTADSRGKIKVNEQFQTQVPHIYAAGDCIGFPALASTSMEQGRLATSNMFRGSRATTPYPLPYGIYTIPEISMIGKTERELTEAKVPYEVGVAKYDELAKGQMVGDETGMLKILSHPDTLKVLGVHAMGESATEIIHIGQTVLALDGTVEFFRDSVFNYPTFAEAYKVAALNGLNKL